MSGRPQGGKPGPTWDNCGQCYPAAVSTNPGSGHGTVRRTRRVAGHHTRVRHCQRWQDRVAGQMSFDPVGDFRGDRGQGAECDPDRTKERSALSAASEIALRTPLSIEGATRIQAEAPNWMHDPPRH